MTTARDNAEQALLGAVMLSDQLLPTLLIEERLQTSHFTGWRASVFAAMVYLHDADHSIDEVTLAAELERRHPDRDPADIRMRLAELALGVPAVGSWREYAQIVRDEAEWARRATVLQEMGDAVRRRDEEKYTSLELAVQQPERSDSSTLDAEELGHRVIEWLLADEDDAIPTPFDHLNRLLAGGLRAGDVTLIAGWTNIGKSLLADQMLRHAARAGYKAHAYLNEMSQVGRGLRSISAMTRIPLSLILSQRKRLAADHARRVLDAAAGLPFGVTDCSEWPATEIARHIRRHRWDICAVDLFNLIPGAQKTETADEISATLNGAARQAGTHVLLVCQLNQTRNQSAVKPAPVLRDIRNTGQLANDAENVLLIHRDQQEIRNSLGDLIGVETQMEGTIDLAKARSSEPGITLVVLEKDGLVFRELDSPFQATVRPDGRVAA